MAYLCAGLHVANGCHDQFGLLSKIAGTPNANRHVLRHMLHRSEFGLNTHLARRFACLPSFPVGATTYKVEKSSERRGRDRNANA